MEFFCVYCKTRKKFDKFVKTNRIKNKYIIDIKKIVDEEEVNFNIDRTYLKILIFNKIQQAIDKKKDIYYIPDFDNEFSIEKLLNLKKILGENNFNVLIFYNEFRKTPEIMEDVLGKLSKFSNSSIRKTKGKLVKAFDHIFIAGLIKLNKLFINNIDSKSSTFLIKINLFKFLSIRTLCSKIHTRKLSRSCIKFKES